MTLADWARQYKDVRLREHAVVLTGERIVLRPLTEGDWDVLLCWNNDPDVLFFAEGDEVTSRTLEEVQAIYRGVSQTAFSFMVEAGGMPVGECQLQRMNLRRVLDRYPGLDCRRIDIVIGEKQLWGQGIGSEAIGLLVRFGFEQEGADAIFGCDISADNPRSRRAFEKNGFILDATYAEALGRKVRAVRDLVLTRKRYGRLKGSPTS